MSGWRQYRIDTSDIIPKEEDDCFIPADDPMWQHVGVDKIKTAVPQIMSNFDNSGTEKAKYMREHNVQPGTKEWFKLWFTNPNR